MTKREAERVLRVWQERLALDGWDIDLEFDVELDGTRDAEIEWPWSYDHATLRLGPQAREWDDQQGQEVIVHELLHLITRDLAVSVADSWAYASEREKRHVRDRFNHELEGIVDRLAVRLVRLGGLV